VAERTTGNVSAISDRPAISNLLDGLFLLERTYGSHGVSHPLTSHVASQIEIVLNGLAMPFSIQFVGQAVFHNRILVPLDLKTFKQSTILGRAFENLGVNEMTFHAPPPLKEIIRLGEALAKGGVGPSEFLQTTHLTGISWQELEGVRWGVEMEVVDPEVYAATHVSLAVAECESLLEGKGEAWEWGRGLGVVRRLERTIDTSTAGTLRALDISQAGWSVARRCVSATLRVMLVLAQLDIVTGLRRSIAHSVLALACQGLRDRGGDPLVRAAEGLLHRLLRTQSFSRTGIEPHRVRVDALVHQLLPASSEDRRARSILHLILLAYDLERRRRPPGRDFDLTSADLLAFAVQESGRRYDAVYVKMLVVSTGMLPAGSLVKLADGRVGAVIVANPESPLLPRVLIGRQIVIPTEPVSLVSAAILE